MGYARQTHLKQTRPFTVTKVLLTSGWAIYSGYQLCALRYGFEQFGVDSSRIPSISWPETSTSTMKQFLFCNPINDFI